MSAADTTWFSQRDVDDFVGLVCQQGAVLLDLLRSLFDDLDGQHGPQLAPLIGAAVLKEAEEFADLAHDLALVERQMAPA